MVLPAVEHIHAIALWVWIEPVQPAANPFLLDARPAAADAHFSR